MPKKINLKNLYKKAKGEGLTLPEIREIERVMGKKMESLYDFFDYMEGLGRWLSK